MARDDVSSPAGSVEASSTTCCDTLPPRMVATSEARPVVSAGRRRRPGSVGHSMNFHPPRQWHLLHPQRSPQVGHLEPGARDRGGEGSGLAVVAGLDLAGEMHLPVQRAGRRLVQLQQAWLQRDRELRLGGA